MEAVIKLLDDTCFSKEQYSLFLKEYYAGRDTNKLKRCAWYKRNKNYVIAVAIVDGKLAGQATAYSCEANVSGMTQIISWGCDTFVLPQYRGLGLGKELQKYLHENTVNFSSAGYTPLNGIIKQKCGAKKLFENSFVYYPVSNLVCFVVRKLLLKYLKKDLNIKLWNVPFYYYLNYQKTEGFSIQIERYEDISNEVLSFLEETLQSRYDFYIRRDRKYMQWKYEDNPSMTYKLLTVRKGEILVATLFFTDVSKYTLGGIKLYYCKILDSVISTKSSFTQKQALLSVMKYWKSQHVKIDGIASMFNVGFLGKIGGFKRSMLSMYKGETINYPYMAYSDQDLEQMI